MVPRFCTLHRMSSEHWSFSQERLWLKLTRNRRPTLLLVRPLYCREPTPTLPRRSTHRLQPETVYFCVSCMHSTFIILSHMSSFIFSSPTLLLKFSWCLLFVRVHTISSNNMTYAHTLFFPTFVGVFKHVSVLLSQPCWCFHLALIVSFTCASVRCHLSPKILSPVWVSSISAFGHVPVPSVLLLFACCLVQSVILYRNISQSKFFSVSGSLQLFLSALLLSSPAVAASRTWLLDISCDC